MIVIFKQIKRPTSFSSLHCKSQHGPSSMTINEIAVDQGISGQRFVKLLEKLSEVLTSGFLEKYPCFGRINMLMFESQIH